jgi:hypothetical protein
VRLGKLIKDDLIWEYISKFFERNFYRELHERIRKKPSKELWSIWFGDNEMPWGLLIAPTIRKGEWTNDRSEIRRADFEYWTIGHVLKTGIIDPDSNDLLSFEEGDEFIQFYRSVLIRSMNSEYEKELAQKYLNYLNDSDDLRSEPILVPQIRYAGLEEEHRYRLDFAILNSHIMEFVGIELSPSSTHMSVQGIETTTQREMNEGLEENWNEEMRKRRGYFNEFGITTVTLTDADLNDIENCFSEIKEYLSKRPDQTFSVTTRRADVTNMFE